MKKRDLQIIVAIMLVAVGALLASKWVGTPPQDANYVVIYLGSEEYAKVPLSEPQLVTVEWDGHINEVEIREDGVVMHAANCDNQDCIRQGEVTLENIESRIMEGWIVCLPNQVSVELVKGEANED